MKKYLLFVLILCALLILPVSAAWNIQSPDHTGTIQFYDNGVGIVHIDNYPAITFEYQPDTTIDFDFKDPSLYYKARYLWYSIPFEMRYGVITSSELPGVSATWSDI